jgi:hypothetical protein
MKPESMIAYDQAIGEIMMPILLSYIMNFIGAAAARNRSIPIASAKIREADLLKRYYLFVLKTIKVQPTPENVAKKRAQACPLHP